MHRARTSGSNRPRVNLVLRNKCSHTCHFEIVHFFQSLLCTLQPLLHALSHFWASVSLLCLHRLSWCVPLSPQLPQCLFIVSRSPSWPSPFSLIIAIQFLLHFLPPSCPPLRREVIRSLISLFYRINRVMIPRIPHLPIVVYISFIRCPSWPNDVIQLRRLSFPFIPKLSVRESHLFFTATTGPPKCDLAIELLHNSIPHQLLESALVDSTSLPAQGSTHLIMLVVVVQICTQ